MIVIGSKHKYVIFSPDALNISIIALYKYSEEFCNNYEWAITF